jgi:hypothetical protein
VLQVAVGVVSILTGPFGPVQPGRPPSPSPRPLSFNPYRPFRAGATTEDPYLLQNNDLFQSSPALWGRCNGCPRMRWRPCRGRFNPHRPFGGGATHGCLEVAIAAHDVSILTGPLGPVQLCRDGHRRLPQQVSILTGPLGPVQRWLRLASLLRSCWFQSSPALWGRYNPHASSHRSYLSSVSILTGPLGPVQLPDSVYLLPSEKFQSSPALWGRCNGRVPYALRYPHDLVSILTGPLGPVQLDGGHTGHHVIRVSILTGPLGLGMPRLIFKLPSGVCRYARTH